MADESRSCLVTTVISCAMCGQKQKIMKRCTRCAQIFYCSRQCQVKDWPVHKVICNKEQTSDTSLKRSSCNNKKENKLVQDIQEIKNSEQLQAFRKDVLGNLNAQVCQTQLGDELQQNQRFSSQQDLGVKTVSGNEAASNAEQQADCNGKTIQDLSITIFIKHNKSRHELKLIPSQNSFHVISEFLHIPLTKLKLIHKGKMVVESNIKKFLQDKALFLAFGEVAESEEGLVDGAVDTIVKQLGVDRNVAIKALRKAGNVIDAILDLGNSPESFLHVVAGYQHYLERCTWRHKSVLNFITTFLQPAINDRSSLIADVNGYLSPSIITDDNFRPDLFLIHSKCPYVLKLKVGFESNLCKNAMRKREKYKNLFNDLNSDYRCIKFVNPSISSLGVFSDECSTFLEMMNDIGIDKETSTICY